VTGALPTIAAAADGYAAVSRRLERLNVAGAMLFTTAGLLAGPALGLLNVDVHGEQVKLPVEITLTLALFAAASPIPLLRVGFAVAHRSRGRRTRITWALAWRRLLRFPWI
jgi:hypothetical protein